ncbi:hypothetical protein LUZ60_007514 [Juncus effusus]|nr:hypothetical protein LUZ60_007514 [Juncus effusus]
MDEGGSLVGPTSPEKKPNGNSTEEDALSPLNLSSPTQDLHLKSTGDLHLKSTEDLLHLKSTGEDKKVNEIIKSLTERLSAALLTINAKEELVKQHAKVAEEAVAGWERAETEVTILKQNLDSVSRKNISLDSQITHLDSALKECVRQLRHSRDEIQELKSQSSQIQELKIGESEIRELKIRETELQEKLQIKEKESADLKADMELLQLERDLSNQAAESASKINLENIKKMGKIEAECRRLRASNAKSRIAGNLNCVESLTDSHSDVGLTDSETGQMDNNNWSSALITELDQIKTGQKSLVEIEMMDDFLEMERLAGLAETGQTGRKCGVNDDELREKVESVERENRELRGLLEDSRNQAELAESKLIEMEFQLDLVRESQRACLKEIENLEMNKNELELKFESEISKVERLNEEICLYKSNLEKIGAEKLEFDEKIKSLEESYLDKVEKERVNLEEFRVESEKKIGLLENSNLEKLGLLKEKLKEERAKSEEIKGKLEAQIKSLEENLKKERAKSEEIKGRVEENLKKERAKLEEIKGKLEAQIRLLEDNLKKERAKSEEIRVKLEAQIKSLEENLKKERSKSEEIRGRSESKIKSLEKSHLEKLGFLEENLRESRAKSEKFVVELKNYESQLEMTNLEVLNLKNNLRFLEGKIEKERQLSEEFEAKCRKLEAQLERQQFVSSNGEIKITSNGEIQIKQEKELEMAAGKLAECQKTIASLSQQLKSLTNIDQEIIISESDDESAQNPNFIDNGELGLGLESSDDFAHDLIRFTRVNGNGQLQFSSVLSSPFREMR